MLRCWNCPAEIPRDYDYAWEVREDQTYCPACRLHECQRCGIKRKDILDLLDFGWKRFHDADRLRFLCSACCEDSATRKAARTK